MADNLQPLIDLAAAQATHKFADDDGAPYIVVPAGYKTVELEGTLPEPIRKRGIFHLDDAASFIAYYNRHKEETACTLFGSANLTRFVGLLNGHGETQAGWGDHRVVYDCPESRQWQAWFGKSRSTPGMSQETFAAFIEANMQDIVAENPGEPGAADMLQIATTFRANKRVAYTSSTRTASGNVQLMFQTTTGASAGAKGQVTVPESFFIRIPVFEGGALDRIEARFRYDLSNDGAMAMGFELVRPHAMREAAFQAIWNQIAAGTLTAILRGTPPDVAEKKV